jgi:hypothetical protein
MKGRINVWLLEVALLFVAVLLFRSYARAGQWTFSLDFLRELVARLV